MQNILDYKEASKFIKKNNLKDVGAGLDGDWFWTGGTIMESGKVVDDEFSCYITSFWATPIIRWEEEGITKSKVFIKEVEKTPDNLNKNFKNYLKRILKED